MRYGIYYFSGTGNSLWSAKKIAAALDDSIIRSISRLMTGNGKRLPEDSVIGVDEETMVIIFPSYAYEAPLMVRRFLKRAQITSKRIIAIVTYGSSYGGTLSEIKRILKRKGLTLDYADGIKCVENYLPIFGQPKEQVKESRLAGQAEKTDEIINNIKQLTQSKLRSVRPLSMAVSGLFRLAKPLLVSLYRVKRTCNGCGICERVCPAKAITMKTGKKGTRPKFSRLKCEHCQACFNYCPQKAHTLFRLRAGKARYHHPEIPLPEILKQTETPATD